jgi:hypothetical protein
MEQIVKEKESNAEDVSTLLSDVQKWKNEFKKRYVSLDTRLLSEDMETFDTAIREKELMRSSFAKLVKLEEEIKKKYQLEDARTHKAAEIWQPPHTSLEKK